MSNSLWGEAFVVEKTPKKAQKLIQKIKEPKKVTTKKTQKTNVQSSLSTQDQVNRIKESVYKILGKYVNATSVIYDIEAFDKYISIAINQGEIAIDTETNNSLDPLTCKLMGLCLYAKDQQNVYIPINHVDQDGHRLSNQLSEKDVYNQLQRLNNTKIIMHNAKFDYEVLKCTCGNELNIYWDTEIAARILNENEPAKLKYQYPTHIDAMQEKYNIEELFEGLKYEIFDPELFSLYAATDAFMTFRLYEWQKSQFQLQENDGLYNVFMNVEMPCVKVTAEMELAGITIDKEYATRLSIKYHKKLDQINHLIDNELQLYEPVIEAWRKTDKANFHERSSKPDKNGEYKFKKSKNEQLSNPVKISSPTQLAILFYDIFQIDSLDKNIPRGTGEDIISKIKDKYPKYKNLCSLILEKRGLEKLIGTYIDKLPECVSVKDGRLHAHFNQVGADTGRFSSSDPNLQNIPSHTKEIRLMFKAADGKVLVGSDYSQQEPRLLSMYSQDERLIDAYRNDKDLYATIAANVYHNKYEDNLEHHLDGSANPEGKKRRSICKNILLGIMYGRGVSSIAEQTGSSIKDAQKIIDNFYSSFPKVKTWMDATEKSAIATGYVRDLWGRRRRLPDIKLPKYSLKYVGADNIDFNPLLGSKGLWNNEQLNNLEKYRKQLSKNIDRNSFNKLKEQASKENIQVTDNGGFIAQAKRQCVNARIQGGAASMTKVAMKKIYDHEELKKLGFRIVLQIHDEIIGECPKENAKRCAELLCNVMKNAVSDVVTVPFKCDPSITSRWYEDDYGDIIRQEYQERCSEQSQEEVLKSIYEKYSENTPEYLNQLIFNS